MTGKTELLNKYLNVDYFGSRYATIGIEKLEKRIILDNGEEKQLLLWDTSGGERFRSNNFRSTKTKDGCIIVFDLTSKNSF